ncbi:MAG: nucleotidyltransferase family protein [Pseudomonadota bacterium]
MFFDTARDRFGAAPSPEAQLLLLTAKPDTNDTQLEQIQNLIGQVTDWKFVSETAVSKFSAPYLYRALTRVNTDSIPPETMQQLRSFSEYTRLRALKMAAAQIEFHRKCIEPTDARHVYIKGMVFPTQFHGNYTERYSRDIDVLVDERQFEAVILRAVEAGYRVLLSAIPLKYATSKNDLRFATKYSVEIGLVSREGILIEVHRRLDKSSVIFDSNTALSTSETVKVSGVSMNTLKKPLHFVYICYHHSRHLWSRLHWLADLDLVLKSSELELEEIQKTADETGLRPTVDASIEFYERSSRPDEWNGIDKRRGLADTFLQACLINLNGGLELEVELRRSLFSTDLISKTQISTGHRLKTALTNLRSKFRPVPAQYANRPLPASLFWLYHLQRPFLSLGDRGSRGWSQPTFEDTNRPNDTTAKLFDE